MLLKVIVCLMLFVVIGVTRAWCNMVEDAPRLKVCLNGDWLRCAGGDGKTVPGEGWETVRVPEFHGHVLKGSAWFRLDFTIPDEFGGNGKTILLQFVRVRHYARVFLNGQECGENYGCRAPFEVDVTGAARVGQRNCLEV